MPLLRSQAPIGTAISATIAASGRDTINLLALIVPRLERRKQSLGRESIMPLSSFLLFCIAAAILFSAWVPHYRRVGGITFWRVGHVGGSFYVARRVPL